MAEKTRGVFRIIVKSFLSGIRKRIRPKLMGDDHFGTKYYEEPPESSGRKTRGRYFEPLDKDDFQQEMPAEWESWLRYRRQDPPTKEEIKRNMDMIIMKRENAAKLEIEYATKKDPSVLKERGKEQHAAGAFPIYKEFVKDNDK